jgi:tetratricopeptide (TPR) repeat protein/predicted Ser/Thr protein kinase
MKLLVGQALGGRYQIISELGQGGFGTTFLAEDLHLPDNYRCVVKQLKPQATDPTTLQAARRLFDTEAKVLHELGKHPQIPQLFAYFEENREFYLVQEFIPGEELSQEFKSGKKLSESETIALLREILEILEFVHQHQVIHRDVNPRNLIRRRADGKLVLIDFGAVKQIGTTLVNSSGANYTVAIGTPGYRPSEQANGNPRLSSDIYAAGIIGIQALTGCGSQELPTDANTGEISWRKSVKVGSDLGNVLDKMVRYDFRQRYASAREALQAIAKLGASTSGTVVVAPARSVNQKHLSRKFKNLKAKLYGVAILTGTVGILAVAGSAFFQVRNIYDANGFYQQGQTLVELKRYEEALKAYQKAIEIKPDYIEAWTEKAKTLSQLKRDREALATYEQAIQVNPEYLAAWIGRGTVLDNLQRDKEALDSFDKAIQIRSNYPEAWHGRGKVLLQLQRYEEAIAAYDKLIKFNSNDRDAWYNRGWLLHKLSRYEEAIASYDRAIQLKPELAAAWYNRGNSLTNLQRDREAIESYQKAVQFQPNYWQAWDSLGNIFLKLQQDEEAVNSFDRVIKFETNNSSTWANRGWALHRLNRYQPAVESYDKALQLKRNDYRVWYNRGNTLYNLQKYEEAIASYRRAVRYKPDYYQAWYSRGNALVKLKRYREAVEAYDRSIRYQPDYREAIQARNWAQAQQPK